MIRWLSETCWYVRNRIQFAQMEQQVVTRVTRARIGRYYDEKYKLFRYVRGPCPICNNNRLQRLHWSTSGFGQSGWAVKIRRVSGAWDRAGRSVTAVVKPINRLMSRCPSRKHNTRRNARWDWMGIPLTGHDKHQCSGTWIKLWWIVVKLWRLGEHATRMADCDVSVD